MPKTVVGMFDTFNEAQACVRDLDNSGFTQDDISVVASEEARRLDTGSVDTGENHAGSGAATGAAVGAIGGGVLGYLASAGLIAIPGIGPLLAAGPLMAALAGAGIGAATGGVIGALAGMGIPKEEAEVYAEGVRRGGTLVTVQTDSEDLANSAVTIMNRHNVVDIEERGQAYRKAGFAGYNANAKPLTADEIRRERALYARPTPAVASSATLEREGVRSQVPHEPFQERDARLEVVEENLEVGKKAVQTGGVRVKTYVTEKPVQEQVTLREERVNVERRPVDRPASEADFQNFKEGTIEVTETAEKPVVAKEARVVEEVVLNKDVQERTQTVQDTVRRKDVEVQDLGTTGRRTFTDWETDFRSNWQTNYGTSGRYEDYQPAYRYGYDLYTNPRYANRDWTEVESDVRTDWESRQPGTWDRFKNSIRYAWDRARGVDNAAGNAEASAEGAVGGNQVPGIQTGGHTLDGSPDTRGIWEKAEDAVTGDKYDDKTGRRVA